MKKEKLLHYSIQIIVWGFVFLFPWVFTWKATDVMTWDRYLGYVFVPAMCAIVFYANYCLWIDRFLFRKRMFRFLLVNLMMFALLDSGISLWHDYYFEHFIRAKSGSTHDGPPRMMFILRDGMMMALVAALSVAVRMTENWYVLESEKKELEKARSEAELQNLKSQLNPHFLFNTLNNIYSLIAINPDRAQYAVHDLSRLLRHVLYEDNQQWVSLDRELEFMKSYIDLMSLRLAGNVEVCVDFPADGQGIRMAPLLFITLVENAFKHGTSPTEPSFIRIRLKIGEGQSVECRIENSYFPKKDSDRSGSGIGLENLRKRLLLLYPERHALRTEREGDRFVAELRIH